MHFKTGSVLGLCVLHVLGECASSGRWYEDLKKDDLFKQSTFSSLGWFSHIWERYIVWRFGQFEPEKFWNYYYK